MNTKHLLPLCILLSLSSVSAQMRFRVEQAAGGDTFGARSAGQTFTPSVGIVPSPGTPTTLPLEKVTLYHGNFTSAKPSATTFLNIYDGDPNSTGSFVGSSENSIDTTTGLSFRDPMVWSFGKLSLNYTDKYWMVMSSTNTAGGLDVEVSLETEPRGTNNYTGGAGLIANIVEHPASTDAKFTCDFFTGIQGSFTVSGAGCPGSAGIPEIAAPCRAQIGRPFTLEYRNLAAGSTLFVIVGASNTSWSGFTLPLPVSQLIPGTAAGCTLYASLDILTPLPVAGGSLVIPTAVPNQPTLFGTTLYAQGAQGESSGQLSTTALGTIFIGQ